jgi:hypothetical protein
MRRGHCSDDSIDEDVRFAVSQFAGRILEDVKALDIAIMERIVSSPDLRLTDEESLLEFIHSSDSDCPYRVLDEGEYRCVWGLHFWLHN